MKSMKLNFFKIFKIDIDKLPSYVVQYVLSVLNKFVFRTYADVAELADAQDLKSCGPISRAGSIPAICTIRTSSISKDELEVLIFKIIENVEKTLFLK